jgi:hypothetical protein
MELRGILMSSPGAPEAHHYPPTTAEWVTSPLPDHDELERNPLEPAPEVKPSVRLGAVLIIISGILALAGLIVQIFLANVISRLGGSLWSEARLITIGFPVVTIIFPMAFAVGGVVRGITLRTRVTRRSVVQVIQFASTGLFLQLLTIPLAFIQIVAPGSRSGQTIGDYLGPANWLAWASFLIMLAAAWLIRIVARPPVTQEDVNDLARFQHLVDLNRNDGDSRRKITFFRGK